MKHISIDTTFPQFEKSPDSLWILEGREVVYTSKERGVAPLIDYIARARGTEEQVILYDRVVGNAAALLAVKALCVRVFAVMGSFHASDTLRIYGIFHAFTHMVPYIQNRRKTGMCPFEQLSLGMNPDEFFKAANELRQTIATGS